MCFQNFQQEFWNLITSISLFSKNSYFKSKLDMKRLVESTFNVKVISVNSLVRSHKNRRVGKIIGFKNSYKRMFVRLVWLSGLIIVFCCIELSSFRSINKMNFHFFFSKRYNTVLFFALVFKSVVNIPFFVRLNF